MPESSDSFLFVRANQPNKTYIGGTFCAGEETIRSISEWGADASLAINGARLAVSQGTLPLQALEQFGLNQLVRGAKTKRAVSHCLGRIANGFCRVYPPDTSA